LVADGAAQIEPPSAAISTDGASNSKVAPIRSEHALRLEIFQTSAGTPPKAPEELRMAS